MSMSGSTRALRGIITAMSPLSVMLALQEPISSSEQQQLDQGDHNDHAECQAVTA